MEKTGKILESQVLRHESPTFAENVGIVGNERRMYLHVKKVKSRNMHILFTNSLQQSVEINHCLGFKKSSFYIF